MRGTEPLLELCERRFGGRPQFYNAPSGADHSAGTHGSNSAGANGSGSFIKPNIESYAADLTAIAAC
jgi:hypothetical protein